MPTDLTSARVRRYRFARVLVGVLLCGCARVPQAAAASAARAAAPDPAADARCKQQFPSIAAYSALRQAAPHLFASVGDWQRGEITILTEPKQICAVQEQMRQRYAAKSSAEDAWQASRAGVILQDPYVIVLRDAVRFPNGKVGLYNRRVSRSTLDGGVAGAYCLPLLPDGRVVLVKEYRHQERRWRLGLPGGFREPGETAEQAAQREASEETGYPVRALTHLGEVDAEGEAVPLFVASVDGAAAARAPDEGEALAGAVLLSLAELKQAVVASGYREADGTWLSLQANLGSATLMAENYLARRPQGQ